MDRLITKPNDYNLLIVEKSSAVLTQTGEEKDYILEGVFGEIDVKNKNNRIYTEAEYLPQIESLQEKIKSSKLLGELDHPQQFDISLKNVSHVIEEVRYDSESKRVMGKIKLLDTDIVDEECKKIFKLLIDGLKNPEIMKELEINHHEKLKRKTTNCREKYLVGKV